MLLRALRRGLPAVRLSERAATLRSAAVKDYLSLFPKELMDEFISFATEHGAHAKHFGAFVGEEFKAAYERLASMIFFNIKDSADWLKARKFARADVVTYIVDHRDHLNHKLRERSKGLGLGWVHDPYRSDDFEAGPYMTNYRSALGLINGELAKLVQVDKEMEKARREEEEDESGVRRKKPAHERLLEIESLFVALKNMETDPARRFWMFYRRNVSDHVPIMLEVEFL